MAARKHLFQIDIPALAWLIVSFCASQSCAWAEGVRKADPVGRVEVAKGLSAMGTLVRREAADKPWQLVKEGDPLYSGDLVIGLPGASLESKNGAVKLWFRTEMDGNAPLPIIEVAVLLHASDKSDLDFKLDRGRVEIINQRNKGDTHVQVEIRDTPVELIMTAPKTRAALEMYGRWPAGAPFHKELKPGEGPSLAVIFLVISGELNLRMEKHQLAMQAPPGPALIEWNSETGGDPTPQFVKELPKWVAQDENSELTKQRKAALETFRKLAVEKGLGPTLDELVNSKDRRLRRVAVYAMGALDDLPRLGKALNEAKYPDVWDSGVLAVRHWIGRCPGQDQKLYQGLIKVRKLKEPQAETVMQLLHGFDDQQLSQPETYEVLIDYLDNDLLIIRGLAHWHLSRLVPQGREFGFNPLDPKEKREVAIKKWKQLIPSGKLPPKSTVKPQQKQN